MEAKANVTSSMQLRDQALSEYHEVSKMIANHSTPQAQDVAADVEEGAEEDFYQLLKDSDQEILNGSSSTLPSGPTTAVCNER